MLTTQQEFKMDYIKCYKLIKKNESFNEDILNFLSNKVEELNIFENDKEIETMVYEFNLKVENIRGGVKELNLTLIKILLNLSEFEKELNKWQKK